MFDSDWVFIFFATFLMTPQITLVLMPLLKRLKAGQIIQKDGPQSHQSKAGTPTMGGIAFVAVALALSAIPIFLPSVSQCSIAIVFVEVAALVLAYAAIGIVDDWLTIRPRNGRRGMSSKMKLVLQFVAAIIFVLFLKSAGQLDPVVKIGPLYSVNLGWVYAPLAVLLITGMANFVNITDGLDGLAAGLAAILALTLAVIAGIAVEHQMNPQLVVLLWAFAGACAGFLWFNFHPAKIFMGDTGSLAIGAVIPAIAILMKLEVPMIVAGMVFILDGLSSALQWAVFKYTRLRTGTGKRVLKMSPIHHHYELCGWPEELIVVRFWLAGIFFALVAIIYTSRLLELY